MFAGANRRSSKVRVMQIFHELKAQFPTVPDHIITACIASHVTNGAPPRNLHELVLAAAAREKNQMGRPSIQLETPPFIPTPATAKQLLIEPKPATTTPTNNDGSRVDSERIRVGDMNDGDSGDINRNQLPSVKNNSDENDAKLSAPSETNILLSDINASGSSLAKRPNTLDIKSSEHNERKLQLSEKCRDVFKLLNSPILSEKPPRSPLGATTRFASKQVPRQESSNTPTPPKKETVSTPTQTTDTLVNNIPLTSPNLNLSLNFNCQMGLVQSPTKPKCTSRVDLTPTQPWLSPNQFLLNDPASPRSFTSVNLTLRPPTSTPQDPIDITSQNSSLTYSTSSFDRAKGLQSRLQITVGPGNAGSVSSVRARPRSFHLGDSPTETVPVRAGSLNDLSGVSLEAPVLLKQQARIDRLRIELQNGNSRLVIMRQEVEDLEQKRRQIEERKTAAEVEKQLKMEIKHLTAQCGQLADMLDKDEFYNNIYTGPTGPLLTSQHPIRSPPQQPPIRPSQTIRRQTRGRLLYQGPTFDFQEVEGPKWNCSLCTFLNHPYLDKCEECDMSRVVHVSASPGDNIHIHVTPRRISHSWVT